MAQIHTERKRRGLAWWAWLLIALALAALLWFVIGWFNNRRDGATELNGDVPVAAAQSAASLVEASAGAALPVAKGAAAAEAGTGGSVTIAEIAANPAAYLGRTVTVRGPIGDVLGASAFSLNEDAALGGGIENDVLVVGAQQELASLSEQDAGTQVEVTGVVRQADLPALEQELAYDLDDGVFGRYASRPAIVAQSITILGPAAADTGASPAAEAAPAPAGADTLFDVLTVLNAADRTQYADRAVQFPVVYVQSVPGDKVFFVGPAPDLALPVLLREQQAATTSSDGRPAITPGQSVTVVGTLMRLPVSDQLRQLVNLTAADEAALSGQTVFVLAQQVIVDNP